MSTEQPDYQDLLDEVQDLRDRVEELEQTKQQLEDAQDMLHRNDKLERAFRIRVQALLQLTGDLSECETEDDLFRKAVREGSDRLGFDRLGIWLAADEMGTVRGTFGIDAQGELVDERGRMTRLAPASPEFSVLHSREPLVLIGDEPMYSATGQPAGEATQMFAALWDGNDVLGHVSADNQVRGLPLLTYQCELLRLFGSSVGFAFSHKRDELERNMLIARLQDAVARINTLHGLIPICCSCKKIRDDGGYWNKLEVYIAAHSDADFSHGICPECAAKLYPELSPDSDLSEP